MNSLINIQEQSHLMFVKPFSVKQHLIKSNENDINIKNHPFIKISKTSKRIKKIPKNKLFVNDSKSKTVLLFKRLSTIVNVNNNNCLKK